MRAAPLRAAAWVFHGRPRRRSHRLRAQTPFTAQAMRGKVSPGRNAAGLTSQATVGAETRPGTQRPGTALQVESGL